MSRKACTFKQSDVTRALLAAKKAGVEVTRIRIAKDGTIEIKTGKCEDPPTNDNPWDGVLSNAEDAQRLT
jgi:hypothetical protein